MSHTPEQIARAKKILLNQSKILGINSADIEAVISRTEAKIGVAVPSLFHAYEAMRDAPPVRFLIKDFWQAEVITILAALAGHDKTWLMIAIIKALLTGEPLFGYFKVIEKATRVIYLCPEVAVGAAFYRFCTKMKLDEFIKDGRLLIATLSIGRKITLTDSELLEKVPGADLFLDTLPRFRPQGAKESDADGNQLLADQLFNLQALKARSICAAQHSPKEFRKHLTMDLENAVRGSGDIGAMCGTAWGARRVTDASDGYHNLVYVENIKPRDFAPPEPFLLRLRPDIDNLASIGMEKEPGECGTLKEELAAATAVGPQTSKKDWARAEWNRDKDIGRPRLQELIKAQFNSGVSNNTATEWLKEWNAEKDVLTFDPETF